MGRRPRECGTYRVGDEEDPRVDLTATAVGQQLARLEADPRVRAMALVAYSCHIDPVTVAEELDPLKALLRLACHNVLQDERARQNKAASTPP